MHSHTLTHVYMYTYPLFQIVLTVSFLHPAVVGLFGTRTRAPLCHLRLRPLSRHDQLEFKSKIELCSPSS